MKKEYFANKDFNRVKRKKAVTLSVVLVFIILSMSALFAASNAYVFTFVFLSFILIPIISLPTSFKNYPLHDNPIVTINEDSIIVNDKSFKIKDINKISIIIELPTSGIESKDKECLEKMRTSVPEDEYYGSFDIVYYDKKGKKQVEYSYIDHVIDALTIASLNGVKHYELRFAIKKNVVVNECDFKKSIKNEEMPLEMVSKKARNRQLL